MSDDTQAAFQKAQAVKQAHGAELMQKANVTGVGVGLRKRGGLYTQEIAVVVMVRRKVPRDQLAPEDVIPTEIDGVPVDVQQVGEISAQG